MRNVHRNRLATIKKQAVTAKTLNSYVAVLSELFLNNLDLFYENCMELGITEEEMFELLGNPALANLPFLDELVKKNAKQILEDDEVRRKSGR